MKAIKNRSKDIDSKVLYDENTSKSNIKTWDKITPNYKFIKSNGIAMSIVDESTIISIMELDASIKIMSPELSKVMKQLFDGYYQSQK